MKQYTCDSSWLRGWEVLPYSGSFYVCGQAYDTVNSTANGTVLAKLNAQGDPVWMKKYTFPAGMYVPGHGLVKSRDGNLLFLLQQGSTGIGLMKTDTSGNFLWGRSYNKGWGFGMELEETTGGEIIISGDNEHYNPIYNIFLMRTDSLGNPLQYYDFASTFQWNAQMHLGDIQRTQDGGCILTGSMNMSYPDNNIFFAKLDASGLPAWTVSVGGAGAEWGTSVCEIAGGFIYTGRQDRNLILGKIDRNGNPVWNRVYKSVWAVRPRVQVRSGQVEVVTAAADDSTFGLPLHILLLEADTLGNYLSSDVLPDSLTYYNMMPDVKPFGMSDDRVIMVSPYQAGFKLIRTNNACMEKCGLYASQPVVVSGTFPKQAVNACFPDTFQAGMFFAQAGFVDLRQRNACNCAAGCGNIVAGAGDEPVGNGLAVFPNPTRGLFTISGISEGSEIRICNSLGELLLTRSSQLTQSPQLTIDLTGRPAGIYFVQVRDGKGSAMQKIVIE
jgi:hypothetical protein